MKRTILLICLCLSTLTTWAQNANIHFNILKCETKNLSNNVVEALDLKLHQIFNRNSAAAADKYNAFVVVPQLALTNMLSTEGGVVRNVSLAQGELVLIAKNRVDSAEYYAVTIPLEGDAVGSKEKALLNMVKRIKVNNPAFTRFVRTSRKKLKNTTLKIALLSFKKVLRYTTKDALKSLFNIFRLLHPTCLALSRLTH